MRGGGGGKKDGVRRHVLNIHSMNKGPNSFVAMSHGHPDFE